jgi:hypothetical protein
MSENRELDALVAERVMGWPVLTQPDNPKGNDEWYASLPFPCLILHPWGGYWLQRGWLDMVDFRPSESIEAAMQVVEKMTQLGFRFRYVMRGNFENNGLHHAAFDHADWADANPLYQSPLAKSLPEAICRAALAAVKEQNGAEVK